MLPRVAPPCDAPLCQPPRASNDCRSRALCCARVRAFASRATEGGGGALVALRGPGHVGLQNLGNSCYMASVMQLLFSVPEFAARYGAGAPPAEGDDDGAAAGAGGDDGGHLGHGGAGYSAVFGGNV